MPETESNGLVLGFLGVGAIGAPIVERMLAAGHRMGVFDIDKRALEAFRGRAFLAGSPAALADISDVVFGCLPTVESHRTALLGNDGVIAGKRARLYVHVSTTGGAVLHEVAARLKERGIESVDAPVTGGVPRARDGTLTVMTSGPKEACDRVSPYITSYASKIVYLGEKLGAAQMMKLVNNMVSAACLAATTEAMLVGAKAGIAPEVMIDVLNSGTGQSNATLVKIPNQILPRKFNHGGAMRLVVKDLHAFEDEAKALRMPTPLNGAVARSFDKAMDTVGEDADITNVIRHMEAAAGFELPKVAAER
uniref:Putative 2-hydroxy-3-oxopropionate reductase n=1 Tax=uncultured bacterium 1114 TaxID=548901 RepID=B8R936_9BACT|nr:putative 2-hydroxy-3-oxopropionate reductase [uncultured bacterium 1114]